MERTGAKLQTRAGALKTGAFGAGRINGRNLGLNPGNKTMKLRSKCRNQH